MKDSKIKPELLAPAGSFDSLKAAVINGADAVYLGLGVFNARALAENFTIDTLKEAVDYAHLFGTKVYLAINTLIKNNELDNAVDIAIKAWDKGVSAIIVQDLNFAKMLKKKCQKIVLHASTQMGVHNLYGALTVKNLGIERIILSRETPLSEIENIAKNCQIELEYFVHGALCCGFSGNCYFSSLISGKSGNRGRCLQLCRKPYILVDKKNEESGYWLSARDIMLVDELKKLSDAGVCSFKIEGRMRRREYVAEVTRIYRKAIDAKVSDEDINTLKLMFNRGNFSKSHYDGTHADIIYPILQSHMGIRVGQVKSVFKSNAYLNCTVNRGDGLKFLRNGVEVGHALVLNDGCETGFVGNVIQGDEVFVTDSAKKNDKINARVRKLPIEINAEFSLIKKNCRVNLNCGKNSKEFVYSVPLEPPQKKPVIDSDISECFTSLGNTHFECEILTILKDDDFFISKSVLKQLRRDFIADFESYILSSFHRPDSKNNNSGQEFWNSLHWVEIAEECTIIMCTPKEAGLYESFADYIVIKPNDYSEFLNELTYNQFKVNKDKYILDLPVVSFSKDLDILKEIIDLKFFDKFMVNNVYGIALAREEKLLPGYKMNMLGEPIDSDQKAHIPQLDAQVATGEVSKVCSLINIGHFPKIRSIEEPVRNINLLNDIPYFFGRPDIMQYVHCYYRLKRGCGKCSDLTPLSIIDDRGEYYEIKRQKIANCYNLLISSLPENLSTYNYNKKFIDATNISLEEKKGLLNFLKGMTKTIIVPKFLSNNRKLD